ncbi:TraY domain-containing protein [Vibrio tapetis]
MCKKNGRAKLREAEARLAHHLNLFGADWAQEKTPRKK